MNALFSPAAFPNAPTAVYLPLLELGVNQVFVPRADNGPSDAIPLPEFGFPFWSTNRTFVYVNFILHKCSQSTHNTQNFKFFVGGH